MELIQFVMDNWDNILLIPTTIVTLASIIVKLTPTKKDDEFMGKLMPFLETIALNKKTNVEENKKEK